MPTLAETLTKSIRKHFKPLYANFPPGQPLKLGDVGIVRGAHFTRVTNLEYIDGAPTFATRDDAHDDRYEFSSSGSVSVAFTAKGQVDASGVTALKAKVDIGFQRESSVFFNAVGCKVTSIDDQYGLGVAIMDLWKRKKWNPRHVIVTNLVEAQRMTLVVAGSSGASIEIQASSPSIDDLDLGDASLDLALKSASKLAFKAVGEGGHSPLIGLGGIRRRFFRRDDFGTRAAEVEELELEPASVDVWSADADSNQEDSSRDRDYVFASVL